MKKMNLMTILSLGMMIFSFSSCAPKNPYEGDPRYDIYLLATQEGYEGTYEEWLESIRGKDGENGKTPYIGPNGNWWIDNVDTGVSAQGKEGIPGKDGSSLHTGNGVPSTTLGKDGDSYIDLSTWDFYVKENGSWILKGNIQGSGGGNYVPEIHEVTFNTHGGSEVESQYIEHGKKIALPEEPTKKDYVFDGWTYMGEDWKFNIYTVAEDMTLDANWIYKPELPDVPSDPSENDEPQYFKGFRAIERNTHKNLSYTKEYDPVIGYHYVIDTSTVTTSTYFVFDNVTELNPKFYTGYEVNIYVEGDVDTNIIAWTEDWSSKGDTILGTHKRGEWKTSVLTLNTWNGIRGAKGVGFYDIMTKGKVKVSFGKPLAIQTEGEHKMYHSNVTDYLSAKSEADIVKALKRNTPYNDPIKKRVFIDNTENKEYKILFSTNEDMKNPIEYKTTSDYFDIPYNVIPGNTYYYQVVSADNSYIGRVTPFEVDDTYKVRTVTVDGVVNVRDIGGWTTTDNKSVKYGMIFRGGRLKKITDTGRDQLFVELGVKTEVDVRDDGTQESNHTHNYLKHGMGQYTQIIPGYTSPNRIHSTTNENIGPVGFSSHSVTSVGNIFKSFADESNYPLYVHCNHGADRTGTILYLLNGLLGVPYEQLVQDFELTTFSASGTRSRSGITLDNTFDRTSEYAGISECSDQNYVAFDKLHELIIINYGGSGISLQQAIENYLITVCGLTSNEISKIKNILLA